MRPSLLLGGVAVLSLSLSACSAPSAPGTDRADARLVSIVASTNVWGNVAESIGGDLVSVTSIVAKAAQDPHSYEATAQDQLTLSGADLVIQNGGGYDPFVETLLSAADTESIVIDAAEASGIVDVEEGNERFNEHVWYSFAGTGRVAEEIADQLAQLDPDNAAEYQANLEGFAVELETLETAAEAIADRNDGGGAAITEPVPVFLLEAAGFVNMTPDAFSEAIEEGGDVPPAAFEETLELFSDGGVVVLAYNEQTASPETERVRAAAEAAKIPVVLFTETLPDGSDYVSWMTANVESLSGALS